VLHIRDEVTGLRQRSTTLALLGGLSVAIGFGMPNVTAAASTVKAVEYPVPVATGSILDFTAGPDGAVWFTEKQAATIGRITTRGAVHLYPLPSPTLGLPPPAGDRDHDRLGRRALVCERGPLRGTPHDRRCLQLVPNA
jgi:hypothetical protein